MLKAAKRYGARLDVRNPTDALKEALPVWSHISPLSGRVMPNSKTAKCLRECHNISTVGACTTLARRLRPDAAATNPHTASARCTCDPCTAHRNVRGCKNPHKCAMAARELLRKLSPAWAPGSTAHSDGLSLTKSRKRKNEEARSQNGKLRFDPSVSSTTPLTDAIRIFTTSNERLTIARRAPRPFNVPTEDVTVYTDGSFKNDAAGGPRCGSGVWFAHEDPRNIAQRVPGPVQSNQVAEIYAVSLAVHAAPPFAPLTIISD
ncbi:RNase H, partial [Trametes versicolor FP-101664 SS1]|uniref:RNase H n=1 Tax=Trametes versicolor (strain FP-101664) TaxID=717944 RepID=UPI0004623406